MKFEILRRLSIRGQKVKEDKNINTIQYRPSVHNVAYIQLLHFYFIDFR